jgi:hypothetical protein
MWVPPSTITSFFSLHTRECSPVLVHSEPGSLPRHHEDRLGEQVLDQMEGVEREDLREALGHQVLVLGVWVLSAWGQVVLTGLHQVVRPEPWPHWLNRGSTGSSTLNILIQRLLSTPWVGDVDLDR